MRISFEVKKKLIAQIQNLTDSMSDRTKNVTEYEEGFINGYKMAMEDVLKEISKLPQG